MSDVRTDRMARLLVNYSTAVKPGDWVGILGDEGSLPILRRVFEEVIKAGGNPHLMLMDDAMTRSLLKYGNDDQINWVSPMEELYYDKADVYIRVTGSHNTRGMTGIPGARMQQLAKARRPLLDKRLNRAAKGEMRWVGAMYPTQAFAQEANMSLEDYEDFVYGACFCDRENTVESWRELSAMQQSKVEWLKGKKQITLQGPNIDLSLSIQDRRFINCDGAYNMPDGEIFTGPVEDSVNGWVRFSYPSIVGGRSVSGIELKFEQGKVVEGHAEQNDDLLQAQLNTDAGSRYLGEFAIGTNFGINRFTGSILFDEKIGGTIHMAIGMGYPESGSKNTSAVHWDMICDMRQDSEIRVDGDLFYQNGQFVV
jgi:aminopeptidase